MIIMNVFDPKRADVFGKNFHRTLFYICILSSFISSFSNSQLGVQHPLNYTGYAMAFLSLIGVITKQTKKYCILLYTIGILIYSPSIFIITDGPMGGNALFPIALAFPLLVFYDGIPRIIISSLVFIEYIVLILLRNFKPEMFVQYTDNTAQMTAYIISFSMAFAIVYSMTSSFVAVLKSDESARQELFNELQKTNDQLKELSLRDTVTGAYNRRYLMPVLEDEFNRVEADPINVSLGFLMIDIDHFKVINDTFGHAFGDFILKQVVDAIIKDLRNQDILARFGGEEFAVLLPNTSDQYLNLVAERVRTTISELKNRENHQVTISIGVSSYLHGDTLTTLMARADKNLYVAKNSGRNRVCSLTEFEEPEVSKVVKITSSEFTETDKFPEEI